MAALATGLSLIVNDLLSTWTACALNRSIECCIVELTVLTVPGAGLTCTRIVPCSSGAHLALIACEIVDLLYGTLRLALLHYRVHSCIPCTVETLDLPLWCLKAVCTVWGTLETLLGSYIEIGGVWALAALVLGPVEESISAWAGWPTRLVKGVNFEGRDALCASDVKTRAQAGGTVGGTGLACEGCLVKEGGSWTLLAGHSRVVEEGGCIALGPTPATAVHESSFRTSVTSHRAFHTQAAVCAIPRTLRTALGCLIGISPLFTLEAGLFL